VLQQQEPVLQQQETGVAATGTSLWSKKTVPKLQSASFEIFVPSHSLKLRSEK